MSIELTALVFCNAFYSSNHKYDISIFIWQVIFSFYSVGVRRRPMIISFIVAILVLSLTVWFYLKASPSGTTLKSRLGFEASVLTSEIVGCIGVSYYSY